jgi:hypothetical protein
LLQYLCERKLRKKTTKTQTERETITMKTKLTKTIMSSLAFTCALVSLVAAITLGTPRTAQAALQPCSVGMLRGLYLWTFDGYQNFGGKPVPKALMIGIQFNGNGTFTIPFSTVNIGGNAFDANGGVGTYTAAADCTGTLQVTGGTSFKMYVGAGAQQLWITQTGGGPGDGTGLGVGTATRLP